MLILFYFGLVIQLACSASQAYTYMDYQRVLDAAADLHALYPDYIRVADANSLMNNSIPSTKCGSNKCQHLYVEVTDFNQPQDVIRRLPQIFLVGAFHGDERLGPNILIYFIQFLVSHAETNPYISSILKSTYYVIMPMANPSGYFYNKREEIQI